MFRDNSDNGRNKSEKFESNQQVGLIKSHSGARLDNNVGKIFDTKRIQSRQKKACAFQNNYKSIQDPTSKEYLLDSRGLTNFTPATQQRKFETHKA